MYDRIQALVGAAVGEPLLDGLNNKVLRNWVRDELGSDRPFDVPLRVGPTHRLLVPCSPILHIASGNTPHAAFQSVIRGILVGGQNRVKLPAGGISPLETFVARLPPSLRPELGITIADRWIADAEAIVVFAEDATIRHFRDLAAPWQRLIAHGHKVSFGIVRGDWSGDVLRAAAMDAAAFDQLGCLSPQFFWVERDPERFAAELAETLESESLPAINRSLEVVAALRSVRDDWRYRAAVEPGIRLYESRENLDWMIIDSPDPRIEPTPLHRTILVKPLPENLEEMLQPIRRHLSTVGLAPVDLALSTRLAALGATRICPLGRMQRPPWNWHHDGRPSLVDLVKYVEIET
jgi:Acyl-CoA reductase (LuxC)